MKFPELIRIAGPSGKPGAFQIHGPCGTTLNIIASNEMGWDHVSVSCDGFRRLPNFKEMNFVKDLFWDGNECVVQYHPPKSEYVDIAEVLHLWKKHNFEYPLPERILI